MLSVEFNIIYKYTEGSIGRIVHIPKKKKNLFTLLPHCTVNTSVLRNIFTDSNKEDKGE